jgi:ankyrin repeat protein
MSKTGDKVVISPEPSVSHQHAVIEGCPRRGTYGTSLQELRFHHLGIQLRDGSYPLHMAVAAAADVIAGNVIPSSMVTSITSDTIHSLFHVLDMLIRAAPDVVTWTNKFGETPLHIALRSSSSLSSSATSTITSYQDDVVELLLKADPYNLAVTMRDDREGNLPLHLAIATAFTSVAAIVQILARFPSAIRVTNSNGKLPIELAMGNDAIIGIFKDYGKDHVVVRDDDDNNNADASKNVSTVWNKTSYHQPVH